jgi:hypothetical protein
MTVADAPRPDVSENAPSSLAVACVRALMERHGLPKYRQSAWLADAMGLSYSQAHRRMTGASPWTLEDLAKVAGLFGETLADAVAATQPGSAVTGTMNVGATAMPCRIWLGDEVDRRSAGPVVAIRTSVGWSAVPASEATGDVVYRIEKIRSAPRQRHAQGHRPSSTTTRTSPTRSAPTSRRAATTRGRSTRSPICWRVRRRRSTTGM